MMVCMEANSETVETFKAQLRDFKARKGSHRRVPASAIAEMVSAHPSLSELIDPATAIQLRYYAR